MVFNETIISIFYNALDYPNENLTQNISVMKKHQVNLD